MSFREDETRSISLACLIPSALAGLCLTGRGESATIGRGERPICGRGVWVLTVCNMSRLQP